MGTRTGPPSWDRRCKHWAAASVANLPCEVVIAHREYEAWFLAAIESLREHPTVRNDARFHPNPERHRDAKGQLEKRMQDRMSYQERIHQPAFSAKFSLPDAYRRSRSFRKLAHSFGLLVRSMGQDIGVWPPATWTEDV